MKILNSKKDESLVVFSNSCCMMYNHKRNKYVYGFQRKIDYIDLMHPEIKRI